MCSPDGELQSGATQANADNTSSTLATKTVYLIRHAESEENRKLASLKQCFYDLGSFSLPSTEDLTASVGFLNFPAQVDSDVSDVGTKQIEQVAKQLVNDDFIIQKGIKLVAHSPLKRARETSKGMLGCVSGPDGEQAPGVDRVEELKLLTEKAPSEWIPGNYKSFADRIASFEEWLVQQPEDVIAIVGHSQYFKAMLGLSFKFGNCDVWEVQKAVEPETDNGTTRSEPEEGAEFPDLARGWMGLKKLYAYEGEGSV